MLSDLEELENIIDYLEITSSNHGDENDDENGNFDQEEEEKEEDAQFDTDEFIDNCVQIMHDYVNDNPNAISDPNFRQNMIDHTTEIICDILENVILIDNDIENDIDHLIVVAEDLFYVHFMPCRSFPNTFNTKTTTENVNKMIIRLKYLSELPQPAQRTPEWYKFRHNLITASNAYKAFENECAKNQLIYEKCQTNVVVESTENPDQAPIQKSQSVNVNSPMHWGQKYEQVSVMYYEHMFKTKVQDFGCIKHDQYDFLGASPDGIICDPTLPRFGRMLEIKNIVNREITGIPKKEYWTQTQLQMETCDLDECDFLETRFVEYKSCEEFKEDGDFLTTDNGNFKGIIMYFSTNEGKPIYVYKPFLMIEEYFEETWEQEMMEEQQQLGRTWIKNLYWKLEEVSCVLVLRNKKWFQDNIHILKDLWDIILKERISGFEHRAPNKRVKKNVDGVSTDNNDIVGCLLNINKLNGKICIGKSGRSNSETDTECSAETSPSATAYGDPSLTVASGFGSLQTTVIKIRTESFDETNKNIV